MNLETMRLLVEKGLSADDILEIAETLDAPKARSAAAERQARYRARAKAAGDSDDVTDSVTGDVTRDGNAPPLSPFPNENISNPNPHTPQEYKPARKADDFPMPDFCQDPQVWRDFKANRRAKRLPCTPTAHAKLLTDIAKLADDEWPPGRLFEEIVARGWAAAHDPRGDRKPTNGYRNSKSSSTATDAERAIQTLGG